MLPSSIPVRLINQSYVGNETTVITADLGRVGLRHNGLTLTTSDKNFRREVKVEGSDDNQTWVKFEASQFIYDSPNASPARNTTIDYPAVTSRYLRVTIYDQGAPRLIIAGALARRTVSLTATSVTSTFQSVPPPSPPVPFFERPLYLLVGAVVLTVLVIGGLAFRLFRQTQV